MKHILRFRDYILRVLIAADITLNVVLGGKLGETLSASAWRGEQEGLFFPCVFRPVIDFLFWPIERDHCRRAFESEYNFSQRPLP
jgi:hypothetical protein